MNRYGAKTWDEWSEVQGVAFEYGVSRMRMRKILRENLFAAALDDVFQDKKDCGHLFGTVAPERPKFSFNDIK